MVFDEQLVEKYLERAMEEFTTNPLAVQLMRRLAIEGRDLFVRAGLKYMHAPDEGGNAERMLGHLLLRQESLLDQLARPEENSQGQATDLFKRFRKMDASFDVRLARKLPCRGAWSQPGAFDGGRSGRALDILDETSQGRRLLPILGHLPDSSDPRISTRATLFVGRRVQSAEWTARQLSRSDPRIRAHAVEALWGVKTATAMHLFDECVKDPHNRVAGNALVGLHIGGREDAIERVIEMSNDAMPERRITSGWAMGRLAVDGFAERLTEMVRDEDLNVRGMALRALMLIRKTSPAPLEKRSNEEALAQSIAEDQTVHEDLVANIDVRLDGKNYRAR